MTETMRIVALAVLLLSGCATPGVDLAGARDSWNGAPYDEVVLRWGAPVRSTKLTDGRDVYTWVSEGAATRGSVYPSIGISGGSGGVGIGTGVIFASGGGESVRCERTLIFKEGRVVEQNWQGPEEFCAGFRRGTPPAR
jgi:hypothetical protein